MERLQLCDNTKALHGQQYLANEEKMKT